MTPSSVLLSLFAFTAAAEAGAIIFPGQLDHAEGDTCTTNTGASGTCSQNCGRSSSLGESRKCGVKDSKFLFCCETNFNIKERLLDTAAPPVTFQCGRNVKNAFTLDYGLVDYEFEYEEIDYSEPFVPLNSTTEDYFSTAYHAVGSIMAEQNEWPWMALIGERNNRDTNWFCGGVLINDQWVLSAQHCFLRHQPDVVRLGEHDYANDGDGAPHEDFDVAETVPYPSYSRSEAYDDLALLKLASRVTFQDFISPVCLAWGSESEADLTDQQAILTGYGDTEFGGFPTTYLQVVNLTVFPSAKCESSYSTLHHYRSNWPRGIGRETLCAGDPAGGRDACQGDSGGPLVSQNASSHFVLAGIVSRGYGCGHKDYPGLYANLRHAPYLAWIKKVAFATT